MQCYDMLRESEKITLHNRSPSLTNPASKVHPENDTIHMKIGVLSKFGFVPPKSSHTAPTQLGSPPAKASILLQEIRHAILLRRLIRRADSDPFQHLRQIAPRAGEAIHLGIEECL